MSLRLSLTPLFSAAQARAADRYSIDSLGIPGIVLMEHAGRAVADVVARELAGDARVLVVVGKGNNGGDGLVCARHLAGRGHFVDVFVADVPTAGEARIAWDLLVTSLSQRALPVRIHKELELTWTRPGTASPFAVVVDALFGTGLSRPLAGDAASLVAMIAGLRARGARVVAVDVPSGWPTDGEAAAGAAVDADVTVTFAGQKIVHRAEPAAASVGVVHDVDIGLLHPADEKIAVFAVDAVHLGPPAPLAHKGRFGHVGVVVGDAGTAGAAQLSARAALRAGAGLVTLLGDLAGVPRQPELMQRGVDALDDAVDALPDVVVVGPGLSAQSAAGLAARIARVREAGVRVVVDAGALDVVGAGGADCFTPHPGEAARALGITTQQVQRDRLHAARALVDKWGGVVVLKGAQPVVASAHRTVIVDGRAPALAVAGSGDVLAGVVGAALGGAFGAATVFDSVVAAVWLHQQAGRAHARGALASELADAVAPAAERARAPR